MTDLGSSLASPSTDADMAVAVDGGQLRLRWRDRSMRLHPHWLRDASEEAGQIEPTNRQRLFTPLDILPDIAVIEAWTGQGTVVVRFNDGHTARLDQNRLLRAIGWAVDAEEPPAPQAWTSPLATFPYVEWDSIGWQSEGEDVASILACLQTFYRHGYVVFRGVPVEPGTVGRVAKRLGYLVGQNFGEIFDVRVEQAPTDLAYTSIALLAHSDLPYRRPAPGIQLLHCLMNAAPGGDSTLVDGLAASQALRAADPEAHHALASVNVVWRYDMVSDTVVERAPIIGHDHAGRFTGMRFNTKLDTPEVQEGADLGAFYRGRRWLTAWLNNPDHQVTFRLEPGDTMFMDNHRILHGRTAFDASQGPRHLQGCYIEHDGPNTMFRLATRKAAEQTTSRRVQHAGVTHA